MKDYMGRTSMSASVYKASKDGAAAGHSGKKSSTNPHPPGSREHTAWSIAHSRTFSKDRKEKAIESTNPLINATAKLISQQSTLSEMGDKKGFEQAMDRRLVESASQSKRMIIRQMKSDLAGLNKKAQNHRSIAAFHKDCLATATRVDDAEHSQFMSDVHKDLADRVQAHANKLAVKIKSKK